ncbi:hypothetical protein GQ53DRAFT_706398 [Thozetella sp. PMI_491]|nr:hypothetical protein GQ53DRAFT_706398 [Thozetella sp. PMI_491]
MENAPITGLDELRGHLDQLGEDPTLPLNAKLFDDVELQLRESNIIPLIPELLPKITTILKQYTLDPAPIVSLAIKLLGPVSFKDVLSLASPESLIQALESPVASANILAMTIIHKAASTPADAAILSAMPDLFATFLRRWLVAPQVEVGQKGGKVLGDLLDVDCELPPPPRDNPQSQMQVVLRRSPGHGKLWQRLLRDKGTYGLLIELVAGKHTDTRGDEKQLSLAQGRLLRILPRLASLNFAAVTQSPFPALRPLHATNGHTPDSAASDPTARTNNGLLQFAALHMIDTRDYLMQLSLVDFFEALVSLMRVTEYSSYKVETLRSLIREAASSDPTLKPSLLSLPEKTVPEEAEELKAWLQELIPDESVRVQGHWL